MVLWKGKGSTLWFPSRDHCGRPNADLTPFIIPVPSPTASSSRPHPYSHAYRKRPTLGGTVSQRSGHTLHSSFNLRYQDSYTPEYPPQHQVRKPVHLQHAHLQSSLMWSRMGFSVPDGILYLYRMVSLVLARYTNHITRQETFYFLLFYFFFFFQL